MAENLGFLTVIAQPKIGLIGGYLVVNLTGRPLEFHCTAPVAADRIQEILYGDTLNPFLYGERIAQTLLKRSKLPVSYIFTNNSDVLPVQKLMTELPVIYVFDWKQKHQISDEVNQSLQLFGIRNNRPVEPETGVPEHVQVPPIAGLDTSFWKEMQIGNRWIAVPEAASSAELAQIARTLDFAEPFVRLRLAVDEAQKAA
jgi:hypothetical protein